MKAVNVNDVLKILYKYGKYIFLTDEKRYSSMIDEIANLKALKQEPILDKIRAEIDEQYDKVHPYNISCAEGLEMALGIIDKYKTESEEKE